MALERNITAILLGLSILTATGMHRPVLAQQTTTAPGASATKAQGVARQRAVEIIRLINQADAAAIRAFAKKFTAPAGPVSVGDVVERIERLRWLSRGMEFHSFAAEEPTRAAAVFRNRLTGRWGAVHVIVEGSAPHKVTDIILGTARSRDAVPALPPETISGKIAAVDAFATRLARRDAFSGVVALARNNELLMAKAYGPANRSFDVPNRIETRFNVGSMNKLFTAIAVAQLVERGKLSFDDPLSKFMPGYPDAESAKKIRIKHLLSHTSGLGSYFNEAFMNSPTTRFRDVRSYLDVAGKEKLEFTPGTRWSYSNTGMLIAGRIIEIVSGRDYYDYIREHIYRPAGMTGTDSLALDEAPSNVAVPYELRVTDDGTAYTDASFLTPVRGSPAGGGYATASDLIKFGSALRSQKLVSSATLKTLSTAKPELGSPSYGYGFDIARLAPGRDIVGHGGDFAGTCAIFDMIRDTGDPYTVVVLANSPLESCHPLASMIYETFPPVERATN